MTTSISVRGLQRSLQHRAVAVPGSARHWSMSPLLTTETLTAPMWGWMMRDISEGQRPPTVSCCPSTTTSSPTRA